jgi:hypothetical protein
MTRASRWLGLALLIVAARAGAHLVPVPPSDCTFEAVDLLATDGTVVATGAAPTPADALRIVYDLQASQAQFDSSGAAPRAFTTGATSGTIALPPLFVADVRNSANIAATRVGVTIDVSGTSATALTTLTTLTTGLVSDGSAVVEGAPLAADGHFTLVGLLAAGGPAPPLAGTPLVIRLVGRAVPRPDTDQFTLATRTSPVSLRLNDRLLNVRVIFAPGPTESPDFTHPALLRVSVGGTTLAAAALPQGLPARNPRLFIGQSAGGRAALGVRLLRKKPEPTYLLQAKIQDPILPANGPATALVSYDVGGLLSRSTMALKSNRRGTRFHFH